MHKVFKRYFNVPQQQNMNTLYLYQLLFTLLSTLSTVIFYIKIQNSCCDNSVNSKTFNKHLFFILYEKHIATHVLKTLYQML